MQVLIEIVRVLVQKKVREADVFSDKIIKEQEKRYQLYKGIRDGTYTDDNSAAFAIYHTDKSDIRYQQLKSRLRKQLFHALFLFDMKAAEQTEYQVAVYECTKGIAQARILVTNGAWKAATSLATELLAKALHFHLTDCARHSLKILRDYEAKCGNAKGYESYNLQLKEYRRQNDAEILSNELMDQFMLIYGKTVSDKPDYIDQMRELVQHIRECWSNAATFTTTLNYFRAGIYFNMAARDYIRAFAFCQQAEEYLTINPHFSSRPRLGEFAGLAILCSIHERNYGTAEELLSKYSSYFVAGSGNWGLFMSNRFLVAMHTGKYEEAANVFVEVVNHRGFISFSPLQQEKWHVYRTFLAYVVRIELASIPRHLEDRIHLGSEWYEYLNDLSVSSKDKKGMNIVLYILQTLFILEESGLDGGSTRLEPLRQYANVHLKNTHYARSNAFLKMLFILIDSEFNLKKAEKRLQKYYSQLVSDKEGRCRTMEGLEVIPYEKLWEIIVWRVNKWKKK